MIENQKQQLEKAQTYKSADYSESEEEHEIDKKKKQMKA